MTTQGPTVIVMGIMGRMPWAGVSWQVLHYLEGFRRLGCDVYYVEDTGDWPYDPERDAVTDDLGFTLSFVDRLVSWAGLPGRWAYRFGLDADRTHGMSRRELADLFRRADVLVNVTGATWLHDEHLQVPVRMYVESDPVAPQILVALGRGAPLDNLLLHTHHFSFGENLGQPDCTVPIERFEYLPTRQPIVLDWWRPPAEPPRNGSRPFTTISSWQQSRNDVEWNGETYLWSKHVEFMKFVDLPERSRRPFELALSHGEADGAAYAQVLKTLTEHGWGIVDAVSLSVDPFAYRDYLLGSRGEFTVAKDQYVRMHSGWFSDRSASYLAAGLPVVTQETGFSKFIPTGEGLFAFETMDEVLAALEAIESDYPRHSRAAHEIASEYFDAERVCASLLERAGVRS